MTTAQMIKIDRGMKPQHKKKSRFDFDNMEVGDSFYYEGTKSLPITNLGYRLIRGKYSVEKEGKGWRFHLLQDIRYLFVGSTKKPTKYNFNEMRIGDSFYYEGSRVAAITSLATRVATGRYRITSYRNGWKFELITPISHLLT